MGDLSALAATRRAADQANTLGRLDAVIHHVGAGHREPERVETAEGPSRSACAT